MVEALQAAFGQLQQQHDDFAQAVRTNEAAGTTRMDASDAYAKALNGKVDGISMILKHLETMVQENAKAATLAAAERATPKTAFNYKDAKEAKPSSWDPSIPFSDLSMELRNWARTFHKDFTTLLDATEKDVGRFLTGDTKG